ncbi:RluA family pseudouridine synthase [Proteinivorax hydrogeniformans]|uniref:Pseudouridine synthase n=1 Tax=Proteinivorax hydrogeniformans TaxID=1826727 RepID=A0AAU8HRA4_9FIRM
MQEEKVLTCQENNTRVDVFLAEETGLSRSKIQKLIKDGNAIVEGQRLSKANIKLQKGQTISLLIPQPKEPNVNAEDIPINVVYQDSDICVLNKPQGIVVHPAPGHYSGTLVNALLYHLTDLSSIGGIKRPGIVHRLDKDTSGLLVVAKNDAAHESLSQQMANRETKKVYWALVEGVIKEDSGTINAPIGRNPKDRKQMAVIQNSSSRDAKTKYKVIKRYKENTLVELDLITGRTHQIRVHLKHINHPIVGDLTYGYKRQKINLPGQLLHAKRLGIYHPTSKQWMEFNSELPLQFEATIKKLVAIG